MTMEHNRLHRILLDRGYVDSDSLATQPGDTPANLGARLLAERKITPEQLAEVLAELLQLPYVDLSDFTAPKELFERVSARDAYRLGVVPYAFEDGILKVAIADPFDIDLTERLERLGGCRVSPLLATADGIAAALKRSHGGSDILNDVSQAFRPDGDASSDGNSSSISLQGYGEEEGPVVRLLNSIIMAALQKRASDIHIETYEHAVEVKYRIDGVLYPATEALSRQHHGALLSRLKVMADLDIAEKRIPQDGRFQIRFQDRDIDFRVSILPGVFGEDAVIRILDKSAIADEVGPLTLDHLGIEPEVLKKFRRAIREPYGMVLITGPTGSGKTTTLYAALTELNSGSEKIITIEDPVEYQLDGIVQIAVNEKKKLTFARGLRSILRHDPDKIMVGEIRDTETMQIAAQAALTGHLVFTTVHANNVFDVLGRFSHMDVDLYSFVSSLNCVMAQRLVRLICPDCGNETGADSALLEQSGLAAERYREVIWREGAGCPSCHGTGYRGRAAITEFLDLTPRIRDMIVAREPIGAVQAAALEEGLVTLRQSAVEKAVAGETTLKEINRVTFVD